jgi:hypothetical protein
VGSPHQLPGGAHEALRWRWCRCCTGSVSSSSSISSRSSSSSSSSWSRRVRVRLIGVTAVALVALCVFAAGAGLGATLRHRPPDSEGGGGGGGGDDGDGSGGDTGSPPVTSRGIPLRGSAVGGTALPPRAPDYPRLPCGDGSAVIDCGAGETAARGECRARADGSWACACNPGWSGRDCRVRRDGADASAPAAPPVHLCAADGDGVECGQHGKCADAAAGVGICVCDDGYSGLHCKMADPCFHWSCDGHGMCTVQNATAACQCSSGYSGEHCEAGPCAAVQCGDHGVCVVDGDHTAHDGTPYALVTTSITGRGTRCDCYGEFHGERCEHGPCDGKDCGAGTCVVRGSKSTARGVCSCPGSWHGAWCQLSPCEGYECGAASGAGRCSVVDNQAVCMCLAQHHGRHCEQDACFGHSCSGHGLCTVHQSNVSLPPTSYAIVTDAVSMPRSAHQEAYQLRRATDAERFF